MYKIQSSPAEILGYVDSPAWIKLDGGNIIPCAPVEATGISYGGKIYNLPGHNDWPGSTEAFPSMVTDGEYQALMAQQKSLNILLGVTQ